MENSLFVDSRSIQEFYHHFQMNIISNFFDPRNCSLLEMCDVQFAKRETSDRFAVNKQILILLKCLFDDAFPFPEIALDLYSCFWKEKSFLRRSKQHFDVDL